MEVLTTVTILIVEDHGDTARLMAEALSADGYSVSVVPTGEEALQRLTQEKVDCLVVDYLLPLQNGIQTIRAARARHPERPAILVAGVVLPEIALEASSAGAFGCLDKHRNFLPALRRMVRDALCRKTLHAAGALQVVRPVVVGRDVQLRALSDALAHAFGGRGQLVFLVGEEGIGKTTLARRAAEDARALGMLTLVARCNAERLAYGPWFDIHRAYATATREPTSIDKLVTQLAAAPETWNVSLGKAQAAKRMRFERVARFLCDIAAAQPLLVILDDLQLVDTASLEFLKYIAEQLPGAPFAIVGAYRPADVGSVTDVVHMLGRISVEHDAMILHLSPLSANDIGRYVEATIDGPVSDDFVLALFDKTEGHPLSVAEVLRLTIAENPSATTLRAEMLEHISAERLSTVDHRLRLLSEGTLEWLVVAALVGRQFDARVVLDAAGDEAPAAEEALGEACRHGMLLVDEESGELRFHSEFCRDAVAQRASSSDRAAWHAVIGRAIERRYARNLDPWLPVLARHFVEAGWSGDAQVGIDYACRAGARLGRLLAWVEAARLYEDALRLDERWAVLSRRERVSVQNRRSEALWQAGQFPAARQAGRSALDSADPLEDAEEFATAALNFAGPLPGYGAIVKDPAVVRALEDALLRTTDDTCVLRPVVEARLGEELAFSEEAERAGELVARAQEAAKRGKNPAVEAATLRQSQWALWIRSPSEHDLLVRRMDELGTLTGDTALRLEAGLMRALCMYEQGNLVAARQVLAGAAKDAAAARLPYALWLVRVTEAFFAISTGHFDDGLRLAGEAVAFGQACGNPNAELFSAVQGGHVLWLRGEFDAVLRWLDVVATEVPALGFTVLMSRGITLCEAGRVDEARNVVDGLGASPLARLPRDVTWPMNVAYLGEIAVRTGMKQVAADVLKSLRPLASYHVLLPPLFAYGPVSHHLATIAASLGHVRNAREWFRQAIAMARGASAPHWVARTQVEQAAMLLRLEERAEAARVLEEARTVAEVYGLIPLQARIDQLATACATCAPVERRVHHCVFRPMLPKEFQVCLDGEPAHFVLIKGLRYVWELIRMKDQLVDVVDLYEAVNGPGSVVGGTESHGLDATAKRDYVMRLRKLSDERAEAERTADRDEIARIDREVDWIAKALGGADAPVGPTPNRRVQQTVRHAIKLALDRLKAKAHLRELAEFLDRHVKTGFVCWYVSHPDWVFEL
jgi:CheY-like chemotaxis protein/tetratricopeptide (TPR) repeat protein